jgi:hypothetical protein
LPSFPDDRHASPAQDLPTASANQKLKLFALGSALVVPSVAWFLYCIQYSSQSRAGIPDWLAFSGLVYVVLAAAFFFFVAERLNIYHPPPPVSADKMRAYRPYVQVFATRLLFLWIGLFCSLVYGAFTDKTGDNSLDGTILGGCILLLVIIATIWLILRDSAAHPDTSAFLYQAHNTEARKHARISLLLYAGAFILFLFQSLAGHYDPAFTFPVGALLIGAIGAKTLQLYRLNSAAQHGEIIEPYPPLPENSAVQHRKSLEPYPPLPENPAVVGSTAPSDTTEAAVPPAPLLVMTHDRILVLVLVALLLILKFLVA